MINSEAIVIEITRNDFDDELLSERGIDYLFETATRCPLAHAIKRIGISDKPSVSTSYIRDSSTSKIIGKIDPPFRMIDYINLFESKVDKFTTTFSYS